MPNRLINENSPYLLQHADNPVNWYPWGQEALENARLEDKPIFLSIGYAACHWCHVMAHESFEDPEIAAIMNENYVNIKVDREERPDLDSIYMSAVVAMTGHGGWPMSVFLTSDGEPFYGGTYYPPTRRYNMPSFREVLLAVKQTWDKDRQGVLNSAQKISDYLRESNKLDTSTQSLQTDTLEKAAYALAQSYDWKHGGWGSAPKFPQPMAIEYLLRRTVAGDQLARDIAFHALTAMSRGGMYDVVGGGFARYSTDNDWLVPHFEKMLYDNAQLARAYLHGYMVSGNVQYRRICEQTLDYIVREMTHPEGGFYSSLDADSEGEEGKYYIWSQDEIRSHIQNDDDYKLFTTAYSITPDGNFEGQNVLQRASSNKEAAEQMAISEEEINTRLDHLHQILLRIREGRIPPATDDKILVGWNALALEVFAEAARYLHREDYLQVATKNASFILDNLHNEDRLLRSWREGKAQHNAYLEDYASLILALLSVYQTDPDPRWYVAADRLTHEMLEHFSDPQGGFFDTRDDHDPLITRPKDIQDNATPSGNALAASALNLMAAYTGNSEWRALAESMLSSIQAQAARYPTAFGMWLCAFDSFVSDINEVAVIGQPDDARTQVLLDVIWESFRPNQILASSALPLPEDAPPLLANRTLKDSAPTAYVCQNFVCLNPVNSADDLRAQLEN